MVILQSCQYKIEEAIEFAQNNNIQGEKCATMVKEIENDLLKKVDYALCKCHAKFLMA